MNGIFGVGPLEVVVVIILVLLVFGPERLPELTRNLGSMIRRLRETYLQFVTEFRDELAPIATEIDAATRDLRQDLYAIREAADIRGLIPSITADEINPMKPLPAAPAPLPTLLPVAFTAPALPSSKNVSVNANGHTNSIGGGIGSNGKHAGTNGKVGPNGLFSNHKAGPPVNLSDDNPWASVGAVVRSDKLDDDNPWKS